MKIIRAISMILCIVMLASCFAIVVNAGDTPLENLYDVSKAGIGTSPTVRDDPATGNANYYSSHAIPVKAGDVLTFGPVLKDQSWFLRGYNDAGSVTVNQLAPSKCEKIGVICSNAEIIKWTVPEGTTYIRMTTSQMFFDSTMITINREFTKEEYFAWMDKAGVNVDYLRPTDSKEALVNKFPVSDKTYEGRIDASSGKVASASYRSSEFISVQAGDVLYFAAASKIQGYQLSLRDANGKGTTNVKCEYMVEYEDLGRGYAIYAYRMRPGTAGVTVITSTGVYNDGITLATVNQPFTGETYRKMFNITIEEDTTPKDSPLNGLKGLFVGDSISYGSGDALSYKNPYPGRSWAGRIEYHTGLIATNASVGSAKMGFKAGDDSKYWIYNQYLDHSKEEFDVIVMHGGVNDARHNREIGEMSDVDANELVLRGNYDTFVGGLQWLFHNVKKTHPDATLFYIANHRLDGHATGQARNMGPYFDAAKEVCEAYGVNFIDLYNNEELNAKLETRTTKYLPDTLHLNPAGYDILTPYIIEAMEAVFEPEKDETEDTTTATEQENTSDPADETTAVPAPEQTTPQVSDTVPADDDKSNCGGISGISALSLLALIALAGVVIFKKK